MPLYCQFCHKIVLGVCPVQVFTTDLLVCIFLLVCATLPAFSTNYYVYVTEVEGEQDVRCTCRPHSTQVQY